MKKHKNVLQNDNSSNFKASKEGILNEVLRFFINEMIPLKKVESPHLKRLLIGTFSHN